MIERRIKELSIALEALSRIHSYETSQAYSNIADLLTKLIEKASNDFIKEENPLQTFTPPTTLNVDDEIPF